MRMYLLFDHKLRIIAHIMIHDMYRKEKNSVVKRKLFSLYLKTKKSSDLKYSMQRKQPTSWPTLNLVKINARRLGKLSIWTVISQRLKLLLIAQMILIIFFTLSVEEIVDSLAGDLEEAVWTVLNSLVVARDLP